LNEAPASLLLDTCAVLYLARAEPLSAAAVAAVDAAAKGKRIFASILTAWEIAQSVSKNRLALAMPPLAFFNSFLDRSGASLCRLDAEALVDANFLPGRVHKDPMDRMFVSQARLGGHTLLTSDRAILAYGAQGHVKTLNCFD
jgi:PIN domain nuclease of toxin-antitoxin system